MSPVLEYTDFGTGIASVDIDQWVLSTLKTWLPTYLLWIAHNKSLPYALATPVSYANVIADGEWPDHALPAILVATARTDGALEEDSDFGYTAPWLVAVSAVVRGQNASNTRDLASFMELAVRMALVQHPTLGHNVRGLRWESGGQTRALNDPTGGSRFLGEGASAFRVWTDGTVFANRGPVGPPLPLDEYGPYPNVNEIDYGVDSASGVITPKNVDN